MKSDRVYTLDTFDGLGIAFGGFLRHILAPIIKVIGNSFLVPGLLGLIFCQFFGNFLAFLNLSDLSTADFYLCFEYRPAYC